MENVVLTVHLILALLLIGVVLLQRSEGGGLGLGGGGGGVMTGRQAANALSRATWLLATGFLITSVALTVIAARNSAGGSVVDRLGGPAPASQAPASNLPTLPSYSPPPGVGQPVLPPGATAPAADTAPAAAATLAPASGTAAPAAEPATAPAPAPAPATATAPVPAQPATPAPAPQTGAATGGTVTTTTVPITAAPVSN
ncbi:preprotein translocase subunit SecG [Paracoccus sphaerophysae]|uniref:preprotein translocase subunit SecG n=1 Tax=Paracoccus sphaerophysae TaxID=690417 RepID=UPI0009FBEB1C|nr:preprotein translocase subunit SecG [Paracoccus sphaerophysae]